ncbi:MAG: hypothetical protein J6T52_05990 [Bacteroidaceae bacterium]|nr:hypothetical protein [Bacteroidaceae bacterium]
MATIQQNNVNFTNVQSDPIFMVTGKFSRAANNDGSGNFDTELTGDEIAKSFNALEIDWNGAQWPNSTTFTPTIINTTGDLINAIKWASAQGGSGIDT